MRTTLYLGLGLVAFPLPPLDGPDPAPPRSYACHRATAPIRVDGRLDEAEWANAPWTEPFVDIEGDGKPRPRFMTRARMLWDDRCLYLAASMEEPDVWGTLTAHDSVIFRDNDFEVFIDPDGDNHAYAEFEINALNTGWDLFLPKPYRDGGKADDRFEFDGLLTAVAIDGTLNRPGDLDRGWSVEIAIPWASMAKFAGRPGPPAEGDIWRLNFSRVEWPVRVVDGKSTKPEGAKEDNWVWSPQGVIDMHRPERWGRVMFTHQAPGRAVVPPDPTGPARDHLIRVYQAQKAFHRDGGPWARSFAELGLPETWSPPMTLLSTPDGYRATAAGPTGKISIGPDSRFVLDPVTPR